MNVLKKSYGYYVAVWLLLLALFNVAVFVPACVAGSATFTVGFWIGYAVVTVALVGQLVCGWLAFKAQRSEKMLYRLSIIPLNYLCAAVMAVVGAVCMAVPILPWWLAAVLAVAVLVFSLVTTVPFLGAAEYVAGVGEKVERSSSFVANLTVEAQGVKDRAAGGSSECAANSVYEAIRYTDPVSPEGMAEIEGRITSVFSSFAAAVDRDDRTGAETLAREVCQLIDDRARRCRLAKR